jgi:preprotein translocase subunit YajC
MEAVTGVVAALGWGAIVAIAIVLVLLIIVFFFILRQARRSSR